MSQTTHQVVRAWNSSIQQTTLAEPSKMILDYTFHTPLPLKISFILMAVALIAMAVGLFREGLRSEERKERVLFFGLGVFMLVSSPIAIAPLIYFW